MTPLCVQHQTRQHPSLVPLMAGVAPAFDLVVDRRAIRLLLKIPAGDEPLRFTCGLQRLKIRRLQRHGLQSSPMRIRTCTH